MIFFKIWVLVFFFFSLSFLIKTCSVVNLPHKIHRNNFSLKKKQKQKLSLYTIVSSGTLFLAMLRTTSISPSWPLSLHLISLLTHPSPSYMGMSIDWQRKFTFSNKDAKYAKNINTDAKNKNKRETRQRKVFKLSSTCWNGGNRMIWDGICGEGRGTKFAALKKRKIKKDIFKINPWL